MNIEHSQNDNKTIAFQKAMNLLPDAPIYDSDKIARLKLKINNLLWEELPENFTIGLADEISCHILEIITNPQEYIKLRKA